MLPSDEVIQSRPFTRAQLKGVTMNFLAGDDSLLGLVRILSFVTLWHAICIRNRRNYLEELNHGPVR
jgi:hypothetical protein